MELNVNIHSINETQNVTDTFSKREFVVVTQEEYKQYLLLQVVKDKCSILDNYKIGDEVKVSLNFKGRLWTNPEGVEKCFNTLECWRIEKLSDVPKLSPEHSVFETPTVKTSQTTGQVPDPIDSDLPF